MHRLHARFRRLASATQQSVHRCWHQKVLKQFQHNKEQLAV